MANIVWTCWTTLGKAKIRLSERRYNQTQSASHRADVLPIFALMRAFISMVSLCEQCCSLVSGLEASWRKNNMFEFSLNDEPEEWIMELFPQNMFFFFGWANQQLFLRWKRSSGLRTLSLETKRITSSTTLMETDIQTILKGHELPPLLKFRRRTRKKDRKKEGTKDWDNAFSHVNKVYWSKILSFIPHELNKGTLFGIDMIPKHFLDSWHFFLARFVLGLNIDDSPVALYMSIVES